MMGSFDSVHTGTRCGQTKALGKGLQDYQPGDSVVLEPTWDGSGPVPEPMPEVTAFQVAMYSGGFLIVQDGRIVEWVDDPAQGVPAYDDWGHPLGESEFDYAGRRNRLLEHAAKLDAGIEAEHETAVNRVFGEPDLTELEATGDETAISDRRARMAEQADELRRSALGLPGGCELCRTLRAAPV